MREDWIKIELGQVCSKAKKVKRKEMPSNASLIYLDIGGIDNVSNRIVDHKSYQWENAPSRAQQIVKVGDVLFSTVRTYLRNIALVTNPHYEGQICSSGFTVIRGKEGVLNAKYAYFFSLYAGFLQPLNELQTGTSYPAVRDNDVFAQKILLAPFPEQRAIVAKIEQLFSELDNGIANLKAAKDKLDIYRQAVLNKAFEGEWGKIELEQISEAVGGYAFKSNHFSKEGGLYQVIRIGNIRPGVIRDSESPVYVDSVEKKVLDKYLLQKNDVVISLTGTRNKRDYGFTALVDKPKLLLNQRLAYLRFWDDVLPKFFLYFSWIDQFKDQFFGSETGNVGQGNVGMKSIRKTVIPLPSIEQQSQIVQEIETRLSVCDNILSNIEEGLEKAEALRQSILKQAFEGKLLSEAELEACRKEPDWAPAWELLERIKSGKRAKTKTEIYAG